MKKKNKKVNITEEIEYMTEPEGVSHRVTFAIILIVTAILLGVLFYNLSIGERFEEEGLKYPELGATNGIFGKKTIDILGKKFDNNIGKKLNEYGKLFIKFSGDNPATQVVALAVPLIGIFVILSIIYGIKLGKQIRKKAAAVPETTAEQSLFAEEMLTGTEELVPHSEEGTETQNE